MLPPLGLDVSELGLVMTGVAGGVSREEAVIEVGDVLAGVAGTQRRDRLGAAIEEDVVELVDTGLQFALEKEFTVGTVLG